MPVYKYGIVYDTGTISIQRSLATNFSRQHHFWVDTLTATGGYCNNDTGFCHLNKRHRLNLPMNGHTASLSISSQWKHRHQVHRASKIVHS